MDVSPLVPILAQSIRYAAAEKQMHVALWIAAGFSLVVFVMVLYFGRKRLEKADQLNVDWTKEEARLKALADLKKAARSPEEQRALATAAPPTPEPAPLALLPEDRVASASTSSAPASPATTTPPPEGELGRIIGGLHD